MIKTTTDCCALCQISHVTNQTTVAELENTIEILSEQKKRNNEVGFTSGRGQTAVFVIVSPNEEKLRTNLEGLGFKSSHTFERRVGYPAGMLDMYIKNL